MRCVKNILIANLKLKFNLAVLKNHDINIRKTSFQSIILNHHFKFSIGKHKKNLECHCGKKRRRQGDAT